MYGTRLSVDHPQHAVHRVSLKDVQLEGGWVVWSLDTCSPGLVYT